MAAIPPVKNSGTTTLATIFSASEEFSENTNAFLETDLTPGWSIRCTAPRTTPSTSKIARRNPQNQPNRLMALIMKFPPRKRAMGTTFQPCQALEKNPSKSPERKSSCRFQNFPFIIRFRSQKNENFHSTSIPSTTSFPFPRPLRMLNRPLSWKKLKVPQPL